MGEAKRKKNSNPFQIKISKGSFTTVLVILCVIAVIGFDFFQRKNSSPLENFVAERTKGSKDAPLQILEFVDFQCHSCAKGSKVIKEYMKKYPDAIRVSMKYFPLGQMNSMVSATYAECAARQNKFWPYHDIIFDRQDQWRSSLQARDYLVSLAQEVGINKDEFQSCTQSKDVNAAVMADKTLGQSNSIKSTPTYFINGEMVVGFASLVKYLKDYFENKREDLL